MATVLSKVVATQSGLLGPGEEYKCASKVRVPSRLGVFGIGTPTVKGVKLPDTMVWAVSDKRLFIWTNDKFTGMNPKKFVLALDLATEVNFIEVGKQVRELPFGIEVAGTRVDVLLTPDKETKALLAYLRRAAPPSWVTPVDEYLGDARVVAFVEALRRSDWPTAETILGQAASVPDREHLVMSVASVEGRPEGFDAWVAARPESSTAHLVRGEHGVTWAWEIRGGGYAEFVDEDAWDVFHSRLRDAEADLFRAAELDVTDGTPWSMLLSSGFGLSIPKEELALRFDEAIGRSPDLHRAYGAMLQGLCAKWGGSHDEMFAFARRHAGSAVEGSARHGLVPTAHVERWMARDTDESARAGYFMDREVRAELVEHAHRSVLHPAWSDTTYGVSALNMFACTLRLAGEKEMARDVAVRIGTRRTTDPWAYLADADGEFMRTQTGA